MRKKLCGILLAVCFAGTAGLADAATFKVTNGGDSGTGSLRQAVLSANGNSEADVIEIASSVGEISLRTTIEITSEITFEGNGVTIRGAGLSRLFGISSGKARFDRISFTEGRAFSSSGGAAYIDSSAGQAEFINCTFFANEAGLDGGAVAVYGNGSYETSFVSCTIAGNDAGSGSGGGVAVSGGAVRFVGSLVAGNKAGYYADVYVESNGLVNNTGRYNVIGQTNASSSFTAGNNNDTGVKAEDVFQTLEDFTVVDGVDVLPIRSTTANAAFDKIPTANTLGLPDIDARGISRPQMTAIDAGAFELSPVPLASMDLKGGNYIQRGTAESYTAYVYPMDVTLDVRSYVDGIEWTVADSTVIAVDEYGRVSGVGVGETTLRATAHGWDSGGRETIATASVRIKVGLDPLPAPSFSKFSFQNEKEEMGVGTEHTLKLNLEVLPEGTPYEVLFESSDPLTATVSQRNPAATEAVISALNIGETIIKVTVEAENSKGNVVSSDYYLLTVVEREYSSSGGSGGGCNQAIASPLLAMLPLMGFAFWASGKRS